MKRGTAAKVILGKDTLMDVPAGIVHGTDVILGGKAGLLNDFGGLVLSNNLMLGKKVSRGTITTVTVRGQSPLVLPDAIAGSLQAVKAFGGTEQRNIPQPYTQVNYVTNTAQTAVNTGIMIDFAKNYEFEVECRAVAGSWYILQSRASSSGNITGIHGATSGSTITLVVGNVTVCTSAITRTAGNKLYVKATLNAGTATLYVKDETANTEDTQTGSYGTTQPNPTAAVYLLGNAGEQYVDVNSDIYMARIKENDTVVMDYVPARQGATAGFYDKTSGTFKTALTPANLVADGNTVPTPDTPMDIVSNNGVLKLGYTSRNLNVGTLDNQGYTSTGGTSTSTTFCGTLWKIKVNPGEKYTISYGNFPDGISGVFVNTWKTDGTWNLRQAISIGSAYTYTIPAGIGEVNFTLYKTGGITIASNSWVQVEKGDTATPYVPAGYGLYVDGTTETINVHGINIFDKTTMNTGQGWYVNSTVIANNTNTNRTIVIDCKPNTKYSWWHTSGDGGCRAFDMPTDTIGAGDTASWLTPSNPTYKAKNAITTVTTSANAKKLYICAGRKDTIITRDFGDQINDFMVVEGEVSTATEYEPYYNGGTATAEMLLKVGDYQDEQEILSGAVTRKVGVKPITGDMVSNYFTSSNRCTITTGDIITTRSPIMCTHFPSNVQSGDYYVNHSSDNQYIYCYSKDCASLQDYKDFFDNQYAAGTPVIIVYPLATPTTESVTGQTLQVTDGDNIVEITQASLTGLELEATYKSLVQLTIQEVEDANLNNNVEVTIS